MNTTMDAWRNARPPNYETNKDKLYPYSEFPVLNEYKRVKIPICINNLIEHVDYFGCGKQEFAVGIIGFSNCYNVNYEFKLVFDGPDNGRKIPNRIPLSEAHLGSTRSYLKDNSVHTVTVNLKTRLVEGIAQDIARIVNSERGKVIVYGYHELDIDKIANELRKSKQLFYCPIYNIPDNLRLTYWNTCCRAYLGINELTRLLYGNVNSGDIEAAVILTGCLTDVYCGGALPAVVNKLIAKNVANVMLYGYKLWNSNNREVVREHFPSVFQYIFDGDCMGIINYQNKHALVLEPKTTKARGDGHYESSNKSGWRWKIIPTLYENQVFFKLYNMESEMYLQLSPTVAGKDEIRQAITVSKDSKELSDKFYFKPLIIMNGQVAFHIFNDEDKRLELPVDFDTPEDKAEVGHKSVDNDQVGHSSWNLYTWPQDRESFYKNDEQAQCEDIRLFDYATLSSSDDYSY